MLRHFTLTTNPQKTFGDNQHGGLTAPIITKTMKFEITHITMSHRTTGGYFIKGIVNGVTVTATTNDSEAFDWWNDDSELELHKSAQLHCEWKLQEYFLWQLPEQFLSL